MRKALDFLYDAAGYLAAFLVFAIFFAMIAQTLMREIGQATSGTDDFVSWFCAASFFLALAHTFKHGDFVRVTLVIERLDPMARRIFETTALAVAAVFTAYLAWWSTRYVYESWQYGEMSPGVIIVPVWIPQLSFVVGAALLFVAVVDELIGVIRGKKPSYVAAAEERHARGDYSEDF